MNNKTTKNVLVCVLALLEVCFVFLASKSYNNKPVDNVKEYYRVNSKKLSMFVETDNGKYQEYNSDMFPNGYILNLNNSVCVDNNGKEAKDVLSGYEKIIITSNKTVFCYVYFDKLCKQDETLSNCIIRNSNEGIEEIWNSPLEDDGYRYVGTNPNNYICFGTTDKDTCINDPDKYMYRIIGVFEDENGNKHTKVIKKEALNTPYAWNSDYYADLEWYESDLYNGLNGSYFLTNTEYSYMQDSTWTDKISTWNYTMTNTQSYEFYRDQLYGPRYSRISGKKIYLHELNRSGKSSEICYFNPGVLSDCALGTWNELNTKVSLMYVSDYVLSLGEKSLDYVSENNYAILQTGWMHIINNDSTANIYSDWTMTRYGEYTGYNDIWFINIDGKIDAGHSHGRRMSRPVFYLESNVGYIEGTGTISNPIIIS